MADERRSHATATALVLAPIEACAFVALAITLLGALSPGANADAALGLFGVVFLTALVFALPITLIFGALTHRLFQRLGVKGWGVHILAGLIGGVASIVVVWPVFGSIAPLMLLFSAPIGALTGLFAWMIRRPDRDASAV